MGVSKKINPKSKTTNNPKKEKRWEEAKKASVASQKAQGGPGKKERYVYDVESKECRECLSDLQMTQNWVE